MLLDRTYTKDRLGYQTYFEYNGLRQLTKLTDPATRVTLYDYCACGALGSITRAYGTALSETTSFYYDLQGNRTSVVYPDLTGATNRYDLLRRPTVVSDALGSVTNYYDNLSRVTAVSNYFGQVQASVYDAEDRITQMTDVNGVTVTNTYDNLNRPLTRTYPDTGYDWGMLGSRLFIIHSIHYTFDESCG